MRYYARPIDPDPAVHSHTALGVRMRLFPERTTVRALSVLSLSGVGLASLACGSQTDLARARGSEPRQLVFTPAVALHDRAETLLARPDLVSEDPAGRIVVTDISDRDVKVYDGRGAFVRTIGRAGHGPGEFSALMMAQAYRDSVVAYDLADARLSVFGGEGRFARLLRLPHSGQSAPSSARIVDDSLVLLIASTPGQQQRHLLSLMRPDGSRRSSFLSLGTYLGTDAEVANAVGLIADGADGRIFATLAGGDSIWAFDYDGRRLGAFPADPVQPLVSVRSLVRSNGGHLRRARGGYVVDGIRRVIGIVALDSGTVAVQIAPYDGHQGVDPLDGGTVVVSVLSGGGSHLVAREEITGAILGRDRRNRLLVLRYATPESESYELLRGTLAKRAAGP